MNVIHSWVYGPKGQRVEDLAVALMAAFFHSYLWVLKLKCATPRISFNYTSEEAAEGTYASPDKQKL